MSAWAKVKYRFHPKNIENKFDGKRFKMKLTNCYELLILLKGTAKEDPHTLNLKTSIMIEPQGFG